MDNEVIQPPSYIHIERNEFSYRKHRKQKEEDINICVCKYSPEDPDSACGERCLNLLTSNECTPGYCPCGEYCKNQRFQKCQYAKTKLIKTEGRGWGLLADENIKAGQFIIEYCGEVISWKEAKRRSHAYESEGLRDAYIIYLNADESIDATKKGSLARFINHSCQPNCETRKWNVLGEVRVGIFARQDIPIGVELSYNYNFEWYGGIMVKCLCGATTCSGFLGAKSRGFQEAAYVWEDDDDRGFQLKMYHCMILMMMNPQVFLRQWDYQMKGIQVHEVQTGCLQFQIWRSLSQWNLWPPCLWKSNS